MVKIRRPPTQQPTNSQLKRGTSWVRNNYFFVQKINASGNINSCKLHKHVLKSRTKRGHFMMKPWNSLSCDWAIHFLRIRPIDLIGLFFLNIFLLISGSHYQPIRTCDFEAEIPTRYKSLRFFLDWDQKVPVPKNVNDGLFYVSLSRHDWMRRLEPKLNESKELITTRVYRRIELSYLILPSRMISLLCPRWWDQVWPLRYHIDPPYLPTKLVNSWKAFEFVDGS